MATLNPKKLRKLPRGVLYGVAALGALILIAAVIMEINDPGSVARIREATDVVVVEIGAVVAALAALLGPVLALFNLTDNEADLERRGTEQGM